MNIQAYMGDRNERPLDRMITGGGFASLFRTFACVGDSLASGEFETLDEAGNKSYHDLFEHSWGQYMARAMGSKAYNFSRGGMTAKVYMDSFAEEMDFDTFLYRLRHESLTLSAMAFQDAVNLNIERLHSCSLHVYDEGKIKPFCAKYLTPIV